MSPSPKSRSELPTTPIERDPAKLSEILPWYLNGSLSESDAQWVREQLGKATPVVAGARRFDEVISAELHSKTAEVPADIGWERLITRARAENAPQVTTQRDTNSGSVMQTIASWFTPNLGMALAAVLAIQTVAIGYLVTEPAESGYSEYRTVGEQTQVSVLRVAFSDGVSEQQIRESLFELDATIVGGPNQLGEFMLRIEKDDTERLARLAEQLKSAGLIVRSTVDQQVVNR